MTTTELLRYLYADLLRLAEVASEDFVLHPADRDLTGRGPVRGRDAAVAHERALIAATGGTLIMDVADISADEHFGAVRGTLRTRGPDPVAMPFCGLWRFSGGVAVEHWENAADPAELGRRLGLDATGAAGATR